MRTVGVVVEYNPFHNGHIYHVEQAKKVTGADAVVAVMSGNFLQRGEPAIVDKWARAEMALHGGVDLVLELPSRYAVSAAERFAHGAVRVLEATGVVDALCFGSEHGAIEPFTAIADQLTRESGAFQAALHRMLDAGMRYPSAFAKAILECGMVVDGYDPSKPNNTLGLFYTLAIARQGARMRPSTIARTGSGYADVVPTHASIASATALRQLLADGGPNAIADYAPATTVAILEREMELGRGLITWETFTRPLFHQLTTLSSSQLASIADVREGLENRLKKAALQSESLNFDALLGQIATKRYTNTHLQRVLTNVLLNRESRVEEPPAYIRVLGYTERGQQLLKTMRKSATAPVLTRVNQEQFASLEDDFSAATVYALACGAMQPDALRRELTQLPVVVK